MRRGTTFVFEGIMCSVGASLALWMTHDRWPSYEMPLGAFITFMVLRILMDRFVSKRTVSEKQQ